MVDEEAASYRSLLEQERASLQSQLTELGYGEQGRIEYDSNFADTSQVTAERGENETLASQLKDALADVMKALSKLDDGSYGTCERCGNQISPARLEAKPASAYCIDCASVVKR